MYHLHSLSYMNWSISFIHNNLMFKNYFVTIQQRTSSLSATSVLLPSARNFATEGSLDVSYLLGVVWRSCIFDIHHNRCLLSNFLCQVRLGHVSLIPRLTNSIGARLTNEFDLDPVVPLFVFVTVIVNEVGNVLSIVGMLEFTKDVTTTTKLVSYDSVNGASNELTLFVLATGKGLLLLLWHWLLLLWLLGLDLCPFTVHFELFLFVFI